MDADVMPADVKWVELFIGVSEPYPKDAAVGDKYAFVTTVEGRYFRTAGPVGDDSSPEFPESLGAVKNRTTYQRCRSIWRCTYSTLFPRDVGL